jgi:hypothetical protein
MEADASVNEWAIATLQLVFFEIVNIVQDHSRPVKANGGERHDNQRDKQLWGGVPCSHN